jgi:hypothetical protein
MKNMSRYLPRTLRGEDHDSKLVLAAAFALVSEQIAAAAGLPEREARKAVLELFDAGKVRLVYDGSSVRLEPCHPEDAPQKMRRPPLKDNVLTFQKRK